MYFLIFTIILSLVEYIGGVILNFVFNIDLWNYSSHKDAIGKYVCITNSLIWGLLGIINIYLVYPKLKTLLIKLPHIYTYISILTIFLDLLKTIDIKAKSVRIENVKKNVYLFGFMLGD